TLRKALGANAIETRPPGYLLRAAGTDLAEFESLTESACREPEAARRAALYREALSLWRGPALDEFRREPFAMAAARRLADPRPTGRARRRRVHRLDARTAARTALRGRARTSPRVARRSPGRAARAGRGARAHTLGGRRRGPHRRVHLERPRRRPCTTRGRTG